MCYLNILLLLILLPLALQPTVGFGLSKNILPSFPICHQLSPSSLNPSSFFFCSTFVTISFYCVGLSAPRQTPNLEDQDIPFLSRSSPLTCLAWEALPVAYATASIALGIMWPHKPHHYAIFNVVFLLLFPPLYPLQFLIHIFSRSLFSYTLSIGHNGRERQSPDFGVGHV
jgi:hypothetical protein